MDIRLLKYFSRVAEELHFTRAATKLDITQPTLSQQIRILEDQLDTVLFHRNGRSIELTDSGYILLKHANRIFLEIEHAKTTIHELDELTRGELKVGCSGAILLNKSLLKFHQEYPNIKVTVSDLKTELTLEKILNSTIDIGVVFLPVSNQQIEEIPLFSSNLLAIASNNHEISNQQSINLEGLHNFPLYLLPKEYHIRQIIDRHCLNLNFKVNPRVESSDTNSLIQMALINDGITILPEFYTHSIKNDSIPLQSIETTLPPLKVGIVYRKGMFISNVIKAFIKELQFVYNSDN